MISVIVPVRADLRATENCLTSLVSCFNNYCFGNIRDVEFIIINDCCEEDLKSAIAAFESKIGKSVVNYRFDENVGYVEAVNKGLLLSQGEYVFVISNDMIVTSSYVKTLLNVIKKDTSFGIVRGISNYVDGYNGRYIVNPFALTGPPIKVDWIKDFSRFICDCYGAQIEDIEYHTGDAFLIKREIIDKIGIYDNRFKQYFGDVDYGMRIRRAGYKLVCALGAWLFHEGAISHRNITSKQRLLSVQEDYGRFRARWDMSLTEKYPGIDNIDFEKYCGTKLNLGSGEHQIKGYWNIDHKLGTEAYPLKVPDNSMDEIRASHLLEHFPYRDVHEVLKNWAGKLKIGGVLKIAVPDFRYIAQKYLAGESINVLGYIMGGQVDDDDFHKTIFDKRGLSEAFKYIGLTDIKHWNDGMQDGSSLPVSLNLQGTKA